MTSTLAYTLTIITHRTPFSFYPHMVLVHARTSHVTHDLSVRILILLDSALIRGGFNEDLNKRR
jgi:hypothetical protein